MSGEKIIQLICELLEKEGKRINDNNIVMKLRELKNIGVIGDVSQQRELLLAFLKFYHNPNHNTVNTTFSEDVDMFLANNCG